MDVSGQFHAPAALSREKGFSKFFTEPGRAGCPGGRTLSLRQSCRARGSDKRDTCTGCGRNNSHILKFNKNQTKQGTQKIILLMKSTYDAISFSNNLKITSLKCRPLLMTNSWSRSRKLSMALRVIVGGMAATSCRIASFKCSIVPGRRTSGGEWRR